MRRLIRRLRAKRGATATVVAFAHIPLLGAGAIAVDVGALYAERAQLQNGVDAAALAIAAVCAKEESDCATPVSLKPTAQSYVESNAAILREPAANKPEIDRTDNVVTVTAMTSVDHALASLLTGTDSSDVSASGSAEWGTPIAGSTLPLAIGICEFDGHPPADETEIPEKILVEYNTAARAGCDVTYSPGGFGWLDAVDCVASIDISAAKSGIRATAATAWRRAAATRRTTSSPCSAPTVLIPIYDSFKKVSHECTEANDDKGGVVCFHIAKFAAFELTGFKLSGGDPYVDAGAPACTGSCRGLQGYFVKYVSVDYAFKLGEADPDGLSVVRLLLTDDERESLIG